MANVKAVLVKEKFITKIFKKKDSIKSSQSLMKVSFTRDVISPQPPFALEPSC